MVGPGLQLRAVFEGQAEQARHELEGERDRECLDYIDFGSVADVRDTAVGDLHSQIRHALHARRREGSADDTAMACMHLAISDA